MRIELKGKVDRLDPLTFIFTDLGITIDWNKASFQASGYTHYDVIAIGGGGGRGGTCDGVDTLDSGRTIRAYGGEGGGGGFHRATGLLSFLSDDLEIIVGGPGDNGTDNSDPDSTTDGSNGLDSEFAVGDSLCYASGGGGGLRAASCSRLVSSGANGGRGGMGKSHDQLGGESGVAAELDPAGIVTPLTPGIPGKDGSFGLDDPVYWSTYVGGGGGGGAGGVGQYTDIPIAEATRGGRGSYSSSDESVFGPGSLPSFDPTDFSTSKIVPGKGGGARATILNGALADYGKAGQQGIVVVRLISEHVFLY